MCTFIIFSDLWRHFLTRSIVRPEKVANKICFIYSIHVEIGGLKHAGWRKITRFCFDEHSYTEFAEKCSRIEDGFISFFVISFSFISNMSSFLRGSLPLLIIIFLVFLSIILTSFSSKIANHPLSQNNPIDTNTCFKSGKR